MSERQLSRRPVYTQEQLNRYFDRISLPPKYRKPLIGDPLDSLSGLALLAALQRYHLAAVPFENLDLHYSGHRRINIDPQALFHKIVEQDNGRGGYCMENNSLFGTVLRSLGYDVYSVGARVNEAAQPISASKSWKGPKYDGW
jgi:arylamine N-acetyltransferase